MLRITYQTRDPISDALALALNEQKTLEQVLRWAQERAFEICTMVQQDEYTTDLVLRLPDGLVLVYDLSCIGRVRGVAVWEHVPTADELLQARLERGWKPTHSNLNSGEKVLGYAACLEQASV